MRQDIGKLAQQADVGQTDRDEMKGEQGNTQRSIGAVLERLSTIDEKLSAGAKKHEVFEQTLQMLDRRTDITEDMVVAIKLSLTPENEKSLFERVAKLEVFHGKMGAVVAGASAVLSAVFTLIFIGFKWIWEHWSEFKATIGSVFSGHS